MVFALLLLLQRGDLKGEQQPPLPESILKRVPPAPVVPADKAIFFPDVASLFRIYFAPADFFSSVNTMGLPRYARQFPDPEDRWVKLHVQSNPLPICLRPKVLMIARRGA